MGQKKLENQIVLLKGHTQTFTCVGRARNSLPVNAKYQNKYICVDDNGLVLFVDKSQIKSSKKIVEPRTSYYF